MKTYTKKLFMKSKLQYRYENVKVVFLACILGLTKLSHQILHSLCYRLPQEQKNPCSEACL